jgi:hypothetical protein
MENFSVNSAKSFIGKNVNLHLKDGAVIVNVQLKAILKGVGKHSLLEYNTSGKRSNRIPLRTIAYAEMINASLFLAAS